MIGSAVKLAFQADDQGATIVRQPGLDFIDDGPAKAVNIWDGIGRYPVLAAGNANGDIPMLRLTEASSPASLCILVNHDDAAREFEYTAGADPLDPDTLELLWAVDGPDGEETDKFRATPVVSGSLVFVGDMQGTFYALDAR